MNAPWMNLLWKNAPRRGNKHIARGRAQRHPGNNTIVHTRPKRAKALIIRYLQFMYCVFFYAFALAGRVCTIVLFPGCRFALPRAMCLLPRWGASIQGASILYPDDYII